jgi:flavin-dependent dehydrogenase
VTPQTFDFDFAVAGGGPAGTATAITLRELGHSVVLFEREKFPRFHIGESLLASANEFFDQLGVAEEMKAANFPDKWGARLITHDGRAGRGVDFMVADELPQPKTYQVCRATFDNILLQRAIEVGADVRQEHRVADCAFDAQGVTVDFVDAQGQKGSVRVQAIVDASGRAGLLGKKFSLRQDEGRLANIAIYSHYTGVPRLPGDRPDDIRLIARNDSGWFWVIPIGPEMMSVGVVLPKNRYMQLEHGSPEDMLNNAIADTPAVAELMVHAQREWPVRVEKDYSYRAKTYAGDRWLLAGDAGSFLDPVFSTGVSIALESGIEAAKELSAAAKAQDFRTARFAPFSRRQLKRYLSFRDFVFGFYSPWFRDLFFQEDPQPQIFRAVVNVLAGRWNPSFKTRVLNRFFFLLVGMQKFLALAPRSHKRGREAGYNAEGAATN